jgi:hypothetical protein
MMSLRPGEGLIFRLLLIWKENSIFLVKLFDKNIKKHLKLTVVCDRVSQCSKGTKVTYQTIKIFQKGHIFFYIPIIPLFF